MNRKNFLKLCSLSSLSLYFSSCSILSSGRPKSDKLKFVFCNDLHLEEEWGIPSVLDNVASEINKAKPDLVICGGDIISNGLKIEKSLFQKRFKIFTDFQDKLDSPIYPVLGNNDLFKEDTSKEDFIKESGLADFNITKPYYVLELEAVSFIVLDTVFRDKSSEKGYKGKLNKKQLAWLENEVKGISKLKPIILISHIPFQKKHSTAIFRKKNDVPNTHYVSNYKKVLKILSEHNVLGVIQGHTHLFEEKAIRKQIASITSPAICGNWWCGDFKKQSPGFIVGEVVEGELSFKKQAFSYSINKPC